MPRIDYEVPPPTLAEYGIEFFPVTHLSGPTADLHVHPALEFLYIAEGRMAVDIERCPRITAEKGDLVVIHSNAIHAIANVGTRVGTYYVLKISPSFLFTVYHKVDIHWILPFFHIQSNNKNHMARAELPPALQRVWQTMIDEYRTQNSSYWTMQRHLACISLLLCARYFAEKPPASAPLTSGADERTFRLISESLQYINENYARPLSAEGCADLVHLSYSHYAKLFRAVVGKSFKEYLTDFRMAVAYNLLLTSPIKGSEIARRCGYDNHTNFIVAFKKIYSCTPGELRKSKNDHGTTLSPSENSPVINGRKHSDIACADVVSSPQTVVSGTDDCQTIT